MEYKTELAKIRKAKKITIPDLCKQTGISIDTYKSYEYKGVWPSKENLLKIAQCLNTSLDKIIGYSATPVRPESYCKEHGLHLDIMDRGNTLAITNRHTMTEKQIFVPAREFQKLAIAAKEKAAPLSAEVEATLFMVLAQCEQDQLTEQAANIMIENVVRDLGVALLLRDDKVIRADFAEQRQLHKAMKELSQFSQIEKSVKEFRDQEISWRDESLRKKGVEIKDLRNRIRKYNYAASKGRNVDSTEDYSILLNENATLNAENAALKQMCISLLQKHVIKDKGKELPPAAALAIIETELKKRIGGEK